jgi:TolB protein
MNARTLSTLLIAFILVACTFNTPTQITPTRQLEPADTPSIAIPTRVSTTNPETTRRPTAGEYCWITKGDAALSPSQPPSQFLYQPFQGALDSWVWTSQVDHKQPNYAQDGELAVLGEFLRYDRPSNMAAGTQAYNKSGSVKWFSAETIPADLKKQGYFVFGYQSPTYETYLFYDGHDGHDFAVTGNALAAADGKVIFAGDYGNAYGRVVEIYHSQGYLTRYAHLAAFEHGLKVGDEIRAGDPVGTIGGSAVVKQVMKDNYWGVHLHFSVFRWNQERGKWEITDPFGWDPWAGPDVESNLRKQREDPLAACNGEVSYNLWFNGWPQPFGQNTPSTSVSPTQGRYIGGWAGEEPEDVVSPAGKVVFASDGGLSTIYVMNPDGTGLVQFANGTHPAWSSDGNQIAFQQNGQIYVVNIDGSNLRQITYEPYRAEEPDFSPDGSKIAYCSYRADGSPDIYVTDVNNYDPVRLTPGDSWNCSPDWSPDGTQIVFDRWINSSGIIEIFVMRTNGQDIKRLTTLTRQGTVHPAWSPDGQQIAFVVAGDLVIMSADGSNLHYLKIGLQPWSPTWSPDGQYIAFNAESPTRNQEIFIVQTDGSAQPVQVTNIPNANNWWADWSR